MRFSIGVFALVAVTVPWPVGSWGLEGRRPTLRAAEMPAPADPVVVQLASGRCFSGDVAAATDASQLWLVREQDAICVLRPIDWNYVRQVSVLGKVMSGEALHRRVAEIRQRIPVPRAPRLTSIQLIGAEEPAAEGAQPGGEERPQVRSLDFDAATGRWSDTADEDGLILHVYPLDAEGRLVPTRGTLEVDMTGRPLAVTTLQQPFFQQGRWVQEVYPADFGPRGAVYRLPFQAVRPEFDTAVAPSAAVHARLSVPGQGTFDATESTVRIRPFSPVRDQLQTLTGSRFFPQERTSVGRRPGACVGPETTTAF
jgi:hypothetical protein